MGQPHQVTVSGSLVHFVTDMAAPLIITGTGNITVCGKNLFDYANANIRDTSRRDASGTIVNDNTGSFNQSYIKVAPDTTYIVSGSTATGGIRVYYLKDDYTWIERSGLISGSPFTFTTLSNCGYVQIQLKKESNSNWPGVQIEPGTTASTFEAYTGTTAPAGTARKSLVGINNIWSDSGNITVTYWTH